MGIGTENFSAENTSRTNGKKTRWAEQVTMSEIGLFTGHKEQNSGWRTA